MLAFFTPKPELANVFGELSIGRTAGKGIEGAGDAERRMEGDEPNEERRLCEMAGGFMGSASEVGVPGIDGAGDPGARDNASGAIYARNPGSGGAGLDEILRPGKSILVILLC